MPSKTSRRRKGANSAKASGKSKAKYDLEFDEIWTNFAVMISYVLLTAVVLANMSLNGLYQSLLLLAMVILLIGVALRLAKQ